LPVRIDDLRQRLPRGVMSTEDPSTSATDTPSRPIVARVRARTRSRQYGLTPTRAGEGKSVEAPLGLLDDERARRWSENNEPGGISVPPGRHSFEKYRSQIPGSEPGSSQN